MELPNDPWIDAPGLDPRMTCVSTGNPHVIVFCKDVDAVKLEKIGPMMETHPIFPKRINVHFAQVNKKNDVKMRTWETRQRNHMGLRHRRMLGSRRRRAHRANRSQSKGASPRRRFEHRVARSRQQHLHDRPRDGSLQRRMAGRVMASRRRVSF